MGGSVMGNKNIVKVKKYSQRVINIKIDEEVDETRHVPRIAVGSGRIINFQLFRVFLFISIVSFLLIGSSAAQDSLVILNSSDDSTMLQNIEYIESLGGTMTHRFPPHILIGDIPASQINSLKGHWNIVDIVKEPLDVSVVSGYGKTAEIAVNVWNNNYMVHAPEKGLVSVTTPEPGPIFGDMLFVPKNIRIKSEAPLQSLPYGAGFYDSSEYIIGDVAVGIILLESNGVIDSNTENWVPPEESNVVNEIQAGLNWWAAREPKAKLTFTYDIHYKVPTGYEPIMRSGPTGSPSGESLWISDAMTYLGYARYPSYLDKVQEYDNAIRTMLNTDWAYTIFVVDSSNDVDGLFSDGTFAYAYVGGPFSVMNYKNDGYGIANMDAVIAHETGHIFYALDQYTEANSPCTQITGYLAVQNQNSAYPYAGACTSNVDSIMRSRVTPYTNRALDIYARQQVGWRDTDSDGIMDIIDSIPTSTLKTYSPDPTNDNTPTYTGRSTTSVRYPNSNPYGSRHAITINKIKDVQYRVDGGSWISALPVDGIFNSSIEDFTFTTPALSYGTHTMEVRALNTAGNWETSYVSDILTIAAPDIRYIIGTVKNSVNKTGIPGVRVSTNTHLSTTTNAIGFYSLEVTEGIYNLMAEFEPTYYANNTITVSTIGKTFAAQDIELVKKPTGSITGSVIR
jgi:hypothetical protein